jgi:hypothetical protein
MIAGRCAARTFVRCHAVQDDHLFSTADTGQHRACRPVVEVYDHCIDYLVALTFIGAHSCMPKTSECLNLVCRAWA